jgi:hypothetical protein
MGIGSRSRRRIYDTIQSRESQERSDWLVRQEFARQRQTNDTPALVVVSCFVLGVFIALIAAS